MASLEEVLSGLVSFSDSTPWKFTSSAGGSGGVLVIGASGGKLWLERPGEKQELWFGVIGASVGPSPVTGSYSTPSMWSTGVGGIRQRGGKGELTFEDMRGPMVILGGAAIVPASPIPIPAGGSASIIFMNVPYGVMAAGIYMPPVALAGAVSQARAVGVMVGEFRGLDASVGLLLGYAR